VRRATRAIPARPDPQVPQAHPGPRAPPARTARAPLARLAPKAPSGPRDPLELPARKGPKVIPAPWAPKVLPERPAHPVHKASKDLPAPAGGLTKANLYQINSPWMARVGTANSFTVQVSCSSTKDILLNGGCRVIEGANPDGTPPWISESRGTQGDATTAPTWVCTGSGSATGNIMAFATCLRGS
jgi:hypothetical protein